MRQQYLYHYFCAPIFLLVWLSISVAAERPNVVFILADDVGMGDISCYGATMVKTPDIDRLASQGVRLTQAYAAGSVCTPSRYGLLTGQYPCRGPIRGGQGSGASSPLSIEVDLLTLPRFFKQQGYKTAHIGKWHLGYGEEGIKNWAGDIKPGPLEIGFDYHLGLVTNHSDQFKTYVENHRLLWLKDGVKHLPKKPTLEQLIDYRRDDEVDATLTRRASEYMREIKDKPFFICLALVATHTHITPAAPFRGTSSAGQLGDYLHELDHHVGEIMSVLDELNLSENTILIFSSDNGGAGGDVGGAGINLRVRDDSHNVIQKARTAKADARKLGHATNLTLRGHKASTYEGGSRVPFIARWPGQIPEGEVVHQVLSLTDIMATAAGFLKVQLPEGAGADSFDQSAVLLGHEKANERPNVVLQSSRGQLCIREGDWKLIVKDKPKWVNEKVVLPKKTLELYHLKNDPAEASDLVDRYPERVNEMHERLRRLVDAGRSGF